MRRKFWVLIAIICLLALVISGCGDSSKEEWQPGAVTVTVLNGEHYTVLDGNRVEVTKGATVTFSVEVERGYKISGSFGDKCTVSDVLGYRQIVTVEDVKFNLSVQLETVELETTEFHIGFNDEMGAVEIENFLGQASETEYYSEDIISVSATPRTGYRFWCWTTGNLFESGGSFYSSNPELHNIDFTNISDLYANFKDRNNESYTIIYDFGEGIELVQDCTEIIEHHERANTLTAKNLIDGEYFSGSYEFNEDARLLDGWLTEDGTRVGLGSKVAVSDETYIRLYPLWKEYTDKSLFTVSGGMITGFTGEPDENGEVVIPNEIDGEKIVGIASLAFEGCNAKSYYLPNTVTRVNANAFLNCTELTDFYMSDNISEITDASFKGCVNFTTLHLSAYLKPRYTSNYLGGKMEIYERILINADSGRKKLVLLGGSSVRYGYSTKVINNILEDYDVYNFGLNASAGGFVQFQIFGVNMREGDILLHAPELREAAWSGEFIPSVLTGKTEYRLQSPSHQIFCLCENNWDLFSNITVNKFGDLFNCYKEFNSIRQTAAEKSYSDYFKVIGEGEIGGINVDSECIYAENGTDKHFDNTELFSFDGDFYTRSMVAAKNDIHNPIIDKGIKVFVTFSSLNRHNLYYNYKTEQALQVAADAYTQTVKNVFADTPVTILLSQYATIYDGKYFADSDYHLGYPSRDVHTEKVIKALVEALAI